MTKSKFSWKIAVLAFVIGGLNSGFIRVHSFSMDLNTPQIPEIIISASK